MNDRPIDGRGYFALLLMRGLDMEYNAALQGMEYIEAYCKHHGYTMVVQKDGHGVPLPPADDEFWKEWSENAPDN